MCIRSRDKILHTRNQRLRSHRGCSVACSNGLSMVVYNGSSLDSGMSKRIVTFSVDLTGTFPMHVGGMFQRAFTLASSGV